MHVRLLALLLMICPAAAATRSQPLPFTFSEARLEAARLPREATVATLVIHNRGEHDDRLEQVWFKDARRTHIVHAAGLRTDKRGVPLPAGATIRLTRTGEVILLVDLKNAIVPPGPVRAILHFTHAGDIPLDFKVIQPPPPLPPWPSLLPEGVDVRS